MHAPFLEVKEKLSGERHEFHCTLLERSPSRIVLRFVLPEAGEVHGLHFPAGSVTYGYFWPAYPYNVYHWMTPEGETLGFYFNLSGPLTVEDEWLAWQDLEIDVLVTPDARLGYRVQVLDEDELPDDLAPSLQATIEASTAQLMRDWPAAVREISAHSRRLWDQGN